MAMVVAGTVAPMTVGDEGVIFPGRVWLDDDGNVAAVTRAGESDPAGFSQAHLVDVGDAVIHPGFIDLHSHIAYNPLPLWAEPTQKTPYPHHDSWPGEASYRAEIGWPAWTLMNGAPESVMTYVQVRALVGGTTAIQGWPSASRPPANPLVRSVDNDQIGPLTDPIGVSVLTQEVDALTKRAERLHSGRSFVYHCGEGQPGSIVEREFDDLATAGCLTPGLIAIHCCAIDGTHFQRWKAAADAPGQAVGTMVWSPFSNLWLYGITSDVMAAREAGIAVTLGTDWGPSGSKNLLGEIKVARIWSDHAGWGLSDLDLVRMITAAPGDALARAWQQPVGRLVPGALGDVAVVARRHADVWHNLVTARERDVLLVAVGGRALYGTKEFLAAAAQSHTTTVRLGAQSRRLKLVRPDDPTRTWAWSDVLARLDAVRVAAKEIPPSGPSAGRRTMAAERGTADPSGTPPLVVELDMPSGPGDTAGPPPPGQVVEIDAIEPLTHDRKWLGAIKGRGFHGGVLDSLRTYFP